MRFEKERMPMIRRTGPIRDGNAAVEFAIVLPFIMTLLMGILEVGRLIEMQQVLTNATREGARHAATGQYTDSQCQQVVLSYVQVAGFPTTGMTVTVSDLTTPGNDVSAANYLDRIQVTSTYPYQNVAWSTLNYVFPSNFTMSAKAQWISLVDKPFPTFPNPPVG
jgi:Flp pilus assembly protein TadG